MGSQDIKILNVEFVADLMVTTRRVRAGIGGLYPRKVVTLTFPPIHSYRQGMIRVTIKIIQKV